jgi:hypothetical protein
VSEYLPLVLLAASVLTMCFFSTWFPHNATTAAVITAVVRLAGVYFISRSFNLIYASAFAFVAYFSCLAFSLGFGHAATLVSIFRGKAAASGGGGGVGGTGGASDKVGAASAATLAGGGSGTPVEGGIVRRQSSGVALASNGVPRRRGSFGGPAAAARAAEYAATPPSAESGPSAGSGDVSAAGGSALSRLSSLFSRKESVGDAAQPPAHPRPQAEARTREPQEEEEGGEAEEEEVEDFVDDDGIGDEELDDGDDERVPAPPTRRGFGQLG